MSLNLKHSFGPGDIVTVAILPGAMRVLEEVTNISISSHFDKEPIRRLGHDLPVGWATGAGSVAGTLVCAQMTHGALWKVRRFAGTIRATEDRVLGDTTIEPSGDRTIRSNVDAQAASLLPQQLPPFHLMFVHQNDNGQMSLARLYDVTFTDHSEVKGTQNRMTEETLQYKALFYEQLRLRKSLSTDQMQEMLGSVVKGRSESPEFFNDIREPQLVDELKDMGSVTNLNEYLLEETQAFRESEEGDPSAIGIADTGDVFFAPEDIETVVTDIPEAPEGDFVGDNPFEDGPLEERETRKVLGEVFDYSEVDQSGNNPPSDNQHWLVYRKKTETSRAEWVWVRFNKTSSSSKVNAMDTAVDGREDADVVTRWREAAGLTSSQMSVNEYQQQFPNADIALGPLAEEVSLSKSSTGSKMQRVIARPQDPTYTVDKYTEVQTGTYNNADERFMDVSLDVQSSGSDRTAANAQFDIGSGYVSFNQVDSTAFELNSSENVWESTMTVEGPYENTAEYQLQYWNDSNGPTIYAESESGDTLEKTVGTTSYTGPPDSIDGINITRHGPDRFTLECTVLTDGSGNSFVYEAEWREDSTSVLVTYYTSAGKNTVEKEIVRNESSSLTINVTPVIEITLEVRPHAGVKRIYGGRPIIRLTPMPENGLYLWGSDGSSGQTIYSGEDIQITRSADGTSASGHIQNYEFTDLPVDSTGTRTTAVDDDKNTRIVLEGPDVGSNQIRVQFSDHAVSDLSTGTPVKNNELPE